MSACFSRTARLIAAALLILSLFSFAKAEDEENPVTRRALFVGCNFFISQLDTWPSSGNNVALMRNAFYSTGMDFEVLRTVSSTIRTVNGLGQSIRQAFISADDNDVSYFYISTHGVYSDGEAYLLLSDGTAEEFLSAKMLEDMFKGIKGTKVLLIDACNSGALIGKGVSGGVTKQYFLGDEFKILTSAGGSEISWLYSGRQDFAQLVGAYSYFANSFAIGTGYFGGTTADADHNETVTLSEMYEFLIDNNATSTTQAYPQDDDMCLFDISAKLKTENPLAVENVTFPSTTLTLSEHNLSFEFTVTEEARIAYQIVYMENGNWQFDSAQLFFDSEESNITDPAEKGMVKPGRKSRTLSLTDEGGSGYLLFQLLTINNGIPRICFSRIITVLPQSGNPSLFVMTRDVFEPSAGDELPILVAHRFPVELTVTVFSQSTGRVVRRLCYKKATRPEGLTPDSATLYWNGKTQSGELCPSGSYIIIAETNVGGTEYTADAKNVFLVSP
ncbi:MAG: caspase family protein [Eubacteriales bacterium]|nr:caspase family protein [Eubacteriales bacterium]MDD3882247.1 caspase family protein [Eubacteriales bacterium]MDD4512596.1 caspase family protein [Eubacteriales bacterium]